MTTLLLALSLTLSLPHPAPLGPAPVRAGALQDSADVWHVSVDEEDVLHVEAAAVDSTGLVARLPYARLQDKKTLTVRYVTPERYARARTLEFVDESGLVMFSYEEMEESEENPMQIPLDALALALGGAPEGPLTVVYRERSGGEVTRSDAVLFILLPE